MAHSQTEIEEILKSLIDDVEVIRYQIDSNKVKPADAFALISDLKDQAIAAIKQLIVNAQIEILNKAHRQNSIANFDNATDEYIDNLVETLQSRLLQEEK